MKYASRREIYTAVSNLDARNARTGGPRVEIACCGACEATFLSNLPIFPSVLERLESVLFPALSELLSPSRNLSGNGVNLYYGDAEDLRLVRGDPGRHRASAAAERLIMCPSGLHNLYHHVTKRNSSSLLLPPLFPFP